MANNSYKPALQKLLTETTFKDYPGDIEKTLAAFDVSDLAHTFVDTAFLISAITFVGEERWLQGKNSTKEILFSKFIKKLFKEELSPVRFLHDFFEESSLEGIAQASRNAVLIEDAVVNLISKKSKEDLRIFSTTTLKLMSELFELEHQLSMAKQELGLHLGLSLYRTFDKLDLVFNLDYMADKGMVSPIGNTERLYEGAGVGVQSGYSTAVTALRYLNLKKGSRFVDLGSGYGRVGLVVGLMRPDIEVIGYEYVPHRVNIATTAAQKLDIDKHVTFLVQDLSAPDFKIPIADTYYIYDSFSEDTYQHVISQLLKIAMERKITIVTKGNARQRFETPEQKPHWSSPQELDNGNLCFFRSH